MLLDNLFSQDHRPSSFSEKFLYHIWDAMHFHSSTENNCLRSVNNQIIKIHFQGHYNTMSGPDFKNALVEINHKIYTGDIEIHLQSTDWYHHQHDQNPAFNTTILHVVFKHNHHVNVTINENGDQIEILEINSLISPDIEKLFLKYAEEKQVFQEKYCPLFSGIRPEFFEQSLQYWGMQRLEKKIKRLKAELSFVSFDQLFYQSLLEALGYSKNKHQFYLYAKDYKWNYYKQKQFTYQTFVEEFIANAGFDYNKYQWYAFRIRPCNQPQNRLYQISKFIYHSFQTSLTTEVLKIFSFTQNDFTMRNFTQRLYSTLAEKNDYSKFILGKDRINSICVNIFIPLMIIYARINNESDLESMCYTIYSSYSKLAINHEEIHMQKFMTEEQFLIVNKKAIYQQGLLHIYHQFCLNHICAICKENNTWSKD